MQAYLGIKYHPDHRNRPLIDELTRQFRLVGIDIVCVTRDVERWGAVTLTPDLLMDRTLRMIDAADAVILEMSERGVGLGIEAGYAHARNIPVVAVHRSGTELSPTLRGIVSFFLEYDPGSVAAMVQGVSRHLGD